MPIITVDSNGYIKVPSRKFRTNKNRYGLFCKCGTCIKDREEYFYFTCPICQIDTPYCRSQPSGIYGANICDRCYDKGYNLTDNIPRR